MSEPKFRVGQVIAYKRITEIVWRYGLIHHDLATVYDYKGIPKHGWSVIDGEKQFTVPVNAMRPLTKREAVR